MRDPKKLKAFHMSDALVLKVYEASNLTEPATQLSKVLHGLRRSLSPES